MRITKAIQSRDRAELAEAIRMDASSVHQLDENGFPPIYTAVLYRDDAAVDLLLQAGAEVDLFAAVWLNRLDEAIRLLREDPNLVNQTIGDALTPLHFAARSGHFELAKLLVTAGADVNLPTRSGRTPILEACHCGPWKSKPASTIIELLLENGATVDLPTAAAMGRVDLVKKLLDEAPHLVDSLDEAGKNALYLAAENDHLEVVRELVSRGADVNRCDAVGAAALHRVSQQCRDETIQFLIDHGASAHLCCHVACGDIAGVKSVLQQKPEQLNETFYEFNAIGYAIHCWQLPALRLLLESGGQLNQADQEHILRISDAPELLHDLLSRQSG